MITTKKTRKISASLPIRSLLPGRVENLDSLDLANPAAGPAFVAHDQL